MSENLKECTKVGEVGDESVTPLLAYEKRSKGCKRKSLDQNTPMVNLTSSRLVKYVMVSLKAFESGTQVI